MTQDTTADATPDTPQTGQAVETSPLAKMVEELTDKIGNYNLKVSIIMRLVDDDQFKLLSKQGRNALMNGMLDDVADLEELTKTFHRALKKVKRERVPEEIIDEMLGVPTEIRNKGGKDDFDSQPYGQSLD